VVVLREADPSPKDLQASLVRAAQKTREWVERRIDTDALDLARLYQDSRGTMIERLRSVYDEFLGRDTTFLRARSTMGAQALDNAITRTVSELAETVGTTALDSLAELLSVQRPVVNKLVGNLLDAQVHEIPPAKNLVLNDLTTSTVGGGTFFDRVFAMSDDLKTNVTSTVRSSLLNGDDFDTAREKIYKAFGVDKLKAPRGPASKAINIYRNEARRQFAGLMKDIAQEQGAMLVWWATLDERTTPGCAARHGRALNELGESMPRHYNCVAGDTPVQGRFNAAMRMLYAGQIRKIRTTHGQSLSVTPNHAIPTLAGWKRAGELKEGDYLLSYSGRDEDGLSALRAEWSPDNEQYRPTTIEQVFETFKRSGEVPTTLRRFDEQFDGDARFGEGDIEIVTVDSELRRRLRTDRACQSERLVLEPSHAAPKISHATSGNRSLVRGTLLDARDPGESACHARRDVATELPSEFRSFGLCSNLDTAIREVSSQYGLRNAFFARQLMQRVPELVLPDQIIEILDVDFRGHVYDLQSSNGTIVASNLLISNCRCIPAVFPGETDLEEYRAEGTAWLQANGYSRRGAEMMESLREAAREGWAWGDETMMPAALSRVKPRRAHSYATLPWADLPALLVGTLTPEWHGILARARALAQPDHVLIASDGTTLSVACAKGWYTLALDAPGVWIPVPGGVALDAPDGPSWNQPRKRLSQYLIGRWPGLRTVTFPSCALGEQYAGTFITKDDAATIARGQEYLAAWPVAPALDDLVSHMLNRGTAIGSLVFAVARVPITDAVGDESVVDEHDVDMLVDFATGQVLYARERFGPQVGLSPYTRVAVACLEPSGRVWAVRPRGLTFWTLPGGHVDKAESYAQAAQREMREEAGLDVTILRTLGTLYRPWSNTVVMLAQRRGAAQAILTPEEIDAASLVTLDELAEDERYFLTRVLVQPSHLATARILEEWDEEKHPRDDIGRFSSTGGGGAVSPERDTPRDEWGKQNTEKMFRDFEKVKPDLDRLKDAIVEEGGEVDVSDAPEAWDALSSKQQAKAEDTWVENNQSEFYDSEYESWSENLDEPVHEELRDDDAWWKDRAAEFIDDSGLDLDHASLYNAINRPQDTDDDVDVDSNELKWGSPADAEQLDLPLDNLRRTSEERWAEVKDSFTSFMKDKMDGKREAIRERMIDNPPEWLNEQAAEAASEFWSQMEDDKKFEYAKENLSELEQSEKAVVIHEPEEWKPFQDGDDYTATHALAARMTEKRYGQILKDRGLADDRDYETLAGRLWDGWKESPASNGGVLLRTAVAKEFDTRTRDVRPEAAGRPPVTVHEYDLAHVQAYARAQWEVSQYVLSKAKAEQVVVYRGDMRVLDSKPKTGEPLPNLKLERDSLQSATSKISVANEWGGIGVHPKGAQRVVLRVQAPRTAVFSLPVFGQNVHDEQEVVLMGSGWTKWDAFAHNAPTFEKQRIAASEAEDDREDDDMDDDMDDDDANLIDLNAGPHWLYGKGAPYEAKPTPKPTPAKKKTPTRSPVRATLAPKVRDVDAR